MIPNLKINLSAIANKNDGDNNHEADSIKNVESKLIPENSINTISNK
jgi:hypothetical protein